MITSVRLVDFKNFADETLRVGPFTVIVGANASGKSNIRDAFRFLHGIGRGYRLAEIMGGKYGAGGHAEWMTIRGAPTEVSRIRQTERGLGFALAVTLPVPIARTDKHVLERGCKYTIKVSGGGGKPGDSRVIREELTVGNETIYTSHPGYGDPVHSQDDHTHLLLRLAKTRGQRKFGDRLAVRPDQPALTQIREHKWVARSHKDYAQRVIDVLAGMRFVDLTPDLMRRPAFPGQTVLGDSGENLPSVLQKICSDPKRKDAFISWVRELTPMDVTDLGFPVDEITGHVRLVIREKDQRPLSAYSVSDWHVALPGHPASLLAEDSRGLYFFEEIENGIHPARQWLLLELIEKQTAKGDLQVVTTTHSPGLLTFVNDSTFRNTSVIGRLEDTAESIIRPVAGLPNAEELRKTQGLGRLLTGGWMETALAFTEKHPRDEEVEA